MPLTRCPRCRAAVTAAMAVCACGYDLAAARAELAALTKPAATIRWPFKVLGQLPAPEHRQLIHSMALAVASEHRGAAPALAPELLEESDRLLDETMAAMARKDDGE